jgi:drug/metabolite transporter (DMT)-like permease
MTATHKRGIGSALLAAGLFGASTPIAKLLVHGIDPWMLAGLLYLGSGVGLAVFRAIRRRVVVNTAPIQYGRGPDRWWLAAAILAGGIIAPVLMMWGLRETLGSTASLLLNLEGVFTTLIAWFVFRENFDRRIVIGVLAITAGAVVLSFGSSFGLAGAVGPLAIVLACLAWAIDNNLTRKVALNDATQIAMLKGLVAGTVNVTIAMARGTSLPPLDSAATAALVGLLGYGVSLVLFVIALRQLGSARTGAYFSVAPFVGAVIAVPLLHEPVTLQLIGAGALMALGLWLHLTENHIHEHVHEPLEHTHAHTHDEHHQHSHDFTWEGSEPHTHAHRHAALQHRHAHYPDAHHRHDH